MTVALEILVAVLGVLALVAFAGAWQTLNWLGDAEDLIERIKRYDSNHRIGITTEREADELVAEVRSYQRRSPRRS